MLTNCCGCNKKGPKKKDKEEKAESVKDDSVLIQSEERNRKESNTNITKSEPEIVVTISPKCNIACDVNETESNDIHSKDTEQVNPPTEVLEEVDKVVPCAEVFAEKVDKVAPCAEQVFAEKEKEVDEETPKRASITPSLVIEPCVDDDEVFVDGIEPQTPRGDMCTPYPKKKGSIPGLQALPRWFSEEEVEPEERGGTQEPPATPIGRDELALRRHRFFSDLMSAAQAAQDHRVRFDPMGPTVAGDCEFDHKCVATAELENLVCRLESVTVRLEKSVASSSSSSPCTCAERRSPLPTSHLEPSNVDMSVAGFTDIVQGPLAQYLALSRKIGGDVATHASFVEQAFAAQLQYLNTAAVSAAPSQEQQNQLLLPTSSQIVAIQEFREKQRSSPLFNHLSAISESIPALGWVCVTPTPGPHVKEMNDAGQFYTNRVLKEWKGKNETHLEWVRAWVQTLTELQQFVKQHHTTGLVWAGKKGAPPPPPPGLPPPPPMLPLGDIAPAFDGSADERSALFAEINKGEAITRSLKKVSSDMQTHKNPTLRTGPAPFKTPAVAPKPGATAAPSSAAAADKPPVFARDGKKWLVEFQKGNNNLVVENAEMNNVVYMFRCQNSTITVKGKLNSIVLDSCKKCSVVFDSLVSSVEFVNCQSVQMQVLGKVPTISIDKTDGCMMYLNAESLNVEIISSKSSEMNVLIPKGNGDYAEQPIPEQFKTTISGNSLSTIAIESMG